MKKFILPWLLFLSILSNAIVVNHSSNTLDGQDSSYYLNSSNQNAGTLQTARLSGTYLGITKVGQLSTLNVTGTFSSIGKIGINNPAPTAYLDITGTSNSFPLRVLNSANTSLTLMQLQQTAGNNTVFTLYNSSGAATNSLSSSGSSYINGGNVGVNTTAPQRRLSVVGDTVTTGNAYITGMLGVGTQVPYGNFQATNTSGSIINGLSKTIADNVATGFLDYTLASNTGGVVIVDYAMVEVDGSTVKVHAGYVSLSARNQGGTITSSVVHPTQLENDLGVLTDTFTSTDGAGKATLNLQVNTTAATYTLYYSVRRCGSGTVTPL